MPYVLLSAPCCYSKPPRGRETSEWTLLRFEIRLCDSAVIRFQKLYVYEGFARMLLEKVHISNRDLNRIYNSST